MGKRAAMADAAVPEPGGAEDDRLAEESAELDEERHEQVLRREAFEEELMEEGHSGAGEAVHHVPRD
ncbi:MAG: hypothetical protein ACYDAD_08305 [Acidimicrobiales bacterium]